MSRLDALYQVFLMGSFVPLLVYFMLSWRDHIYKSFLRFFDGPARTTVSQSLQGIAGVARAFVVGNFIIGVILAVITSALFAFIRLPYPFLVGALSGKYLFGVLRIPMDTAGWTARGFALGTAAHGIGAARAMQVNADAGAYAGLALGLQVVLASVLMPLIFRWF